RIARHVRRRQILTGQEAAGEERNQRRDQAVGPVDLIEIATAILVVISWRRRIEILKRYRQRTESHECRDGADRLTDELGDFGDRKHLAVIAVAEHGVAIGALLDELLTGDLRRLRVGHRAAESLTGDSTVELPTGKRLPLSLHAIAMQLLTLRHLRLLPLEAAALLRRNLPAVTATMGT